MTSQDLHRHTPQGQEPDGAGEPVEPPDPVDPPGPAGADGPAWSQSLPDPDLVRTSDGWIVYGTGGPDAHRRYVPAVRTRELRASSPICFEDVGPVLVGLPEEYGDAYWAPEVCERDGAWWMYYSVGHGHDGHSLRVARAAAPEGPFEDLGVDLTPDERFAIDASPFQHTDGSWWLFLAHDVLDHERPGTHLAVAPLPAPDRLGEIVPVLAPDADWQIFARDREMYGQVFDWHTLEGPHVLVRDGILFMSYSGGSFLGPGYRTAWAWAEHPAGPWHRPDPGQDILLQTDEEFIGPGHNSFSTDVDGRDVIAFHAWDAEHTGRYLHIRPLAVDPAGPSLQVVRD
jgi:GH43 family beta-xylosidase